MSPDEQKDVAQLLDDALEAAGISQYELARRMADLRGTHHSSQDQAIRRIRRLGQMPTEDVARDIARAFDAELDLPDDWFFQPRSGASLRDAVEEALEEIRRLKAKVAALEKAQGKKRAASPKRQGTSRKRPASH